MQEKRKVTFKIKPDMQFEYCHNQISQTKPNESKEYSPSDIMLMARLIDDLNIKIIEKGASFAQQYLLNKGIKVFGQRGRDASRKEIDQLHLRSCFAPISVA
jgi:hypothetical protein